MQAFCFIKIAKGKISKVIESISKIEKVTNFFLVSGDYDGIIEFDIAQPEDLYDIWVKQLDAIEGLTETNTHIVMKKVDLLQHLKSI
jgi:DNA-binding Lrp family transcriptional regulator